MEDSITLEKLRDAKQAFSVRNRTHVERLIDASRTCTTSVTEHQRHLQQDADEDGGGELNLQQFMEHLGPLLQDAHPDLARLFKQIDADAGGTVDWDEFANFMFLQRTSSTRTMRKTWRFFPSRHIRLQSSLRSCALTHDGGNRPTSHAQPMSGLCMVEADTPGYASWGDDGTVRCATRQPRSSRRSA